MRKRIKIWLLRWLLSDEIAIATAARNLERSIMLSRPGDRNAETRFLLAERVYIELLRITDQE